MMQKPNHRSRMHGICWGLAAAAVYATLPTAAVMAQTSGASVPKNGSCPSGFKSSGSRCVATGDAVAIAKRGSCPSTFKSSQKYCVSTKSGAYAEIKSGSCPTGLKSAGNYCIK